MPLLTKKKYSFSSSGMAEDTFSVVSFNGFEAVSKPYRFEILLVSENTDTDPLGVLQNPAVFTIHRDEEDDVTFNGILMQFEETQEFSGCLFYKAVLTPKLWWLSLTHHNQVFLNQSVPEIMESALKDGGLNPGVDFSFDLINTYPALEYVCQYDESHFDFISRWAQREGIYYFFEQTSAGEKVIFTDSKMVHSDLAQGKDLVYLPQSGLDALHTQEVVQAFICSHNMLSRRIYLKDYNYLKPSLAIEGIADVDENGRGENYIYGVNFDSPEEGNRLAGIRAESLLCRKSIFHGKSAVPFIVPGYTFDLNDHYKEAYNRKYLVTEVCHEGHQSGYLVSGLIGAVEKYDQQMFYSNTFKAIYSDKQFRDEFLTEKPKISGTLNAKIDAGASGEYAELDEYGRYKVILPFDRSGRFGGKASAWLRMMQPSAGANQGIHFPLHKGTEILLTFIDGNPDRPVIAGAVPNPETASPVTSLNQTKSIITSGKNPVDYSVGAADAIGLGTAGTFTTGANVQTDNYIEFEDQAGHERIRIHSDQDIWQEAQERFAEYTMGVPSSSETRPTHIADLIGTMRDFSSSGFAPTGVEIYADQEPYSESVTLTSTSGASTTTTSWANPDGTATTDRGKWQYLVDRGKVKISRGDTFNVQEGHIYDFGGYWNYNLGNSYVENHTSQQAELNKQHTQAYPKLDYTFWNTIVSGAAGFVMGVLASAGMVFTKVVKKPLKLGVFLTGSLIVQFIVGVIVQATNWPGTTGKGDGIKDLIEGGAGKFSDMAANKEFINGKNVKLRADKAWVTKTIVEKDGDDFNGGAYNYTKADTIDINIGKREEHNKTNTFTYNYGGRHEEFNYRGNGLLKEWSGTGLMSATYGIVNSASAKFDIDGLLTHFDATLVGQTIDFNFPTVPKLAFKFDGSYGNITFHAATGGNFDIGFGDGDDIKIVLTENGFKLKSDVDDEKLKTKITDVAKDALKADIQLIGTQLSELRLDMMNIAIELADKQARIKQEFEGNIQQLECKAAQMNKMGLLSVLMHVAPDIKKYDLSVRQQGSIWVIG
ncbi:type VI secretion system tip protein TssI/VgrG [uncultured Desulfobacter sp.]|uniref:type VI secretion system tip protein TssI/VgrG n=1 Tax=uncultured Desulfobacter sp. TaxID=240139 RepID=UPI002AAB90C7|nr:type VI secretion system tip protein TssI/VgrG [uncultured Desulfobacter sp.]